MKIAEQYKELLVLQKEIEQRLKNTEFTQIRELLLWLAQSKSYRVLKTKESKLNMLECFCNIWLEEKKQFEQLGIEEDIFWGVSSLDDIENKYLAIEYCGLRMENSVPKAYCEQAIEELIDYKVGGIAIGKIVIQETCKKQENIVQISQYLKEKHQLITAISLLQYGLKVYENNRDMLLELADCWMEGQQWKQAYECLKKIKKPDSAVRKLISELEKVIV